MYDLEFAESLFLSSVVVRSQRCLMERGGGVVLATFFCSHSIVDFPALYVFGDLFVIVHLLWSLCWRAYVPPH